MATASNPTNANTRSYDPNIIIRAANDKLAGGDLNAGQTLFQSALLNWVDDAREGSLGTNAMDRDSLKEAIATLWIAYAQFLMGAKQYKSATEAFEQAIECPVGGTVGRVWLEYVRFLEERNKPRTAQQVYLRALLASSPGRNDGGVVKEEQDRNLLWHEFLELSKRTTNNPDLTLHDFQQAIYEEHQAATLASQDTAPPHKRARIEGHAITDIKEETEDPNAPVIRTHVVTPSDVELELQTLTEAVQSVSNDPTFMAAWLVRDGDAPPQPPFPSLFEAAPPKLSDPTGKDLLGGTMALSVVKRLLEPSGGVVLQVCRALWMWTLIQEQEAQKSIEKFDSSIKEEYTGLQKRLDERLSVAGAASEAVRMMNEQETQAFEGKAQQERQAILTKIAWDLRQLQWASQLVLNKLQMPGFLSKNTSAGTTVDPSEVESQSTVCAYLHSAFFLRKRIGDKAHETMLRTQLERLKQYVQENPEPQPAPAGNLTPPMGAYASGGNTTPPPYMLPHQAPPPQHMPGSYQAYPPAGGYPPPPPQYMAPPTTGYPPPQPPPRQW